MLPTDCSLSSEDFRNGNASAGADPNVLPATPMTMVDILVEARVAAKAAGPRKAARQLRSAGGDEDLGATLGRSLHPLTRECDPALRFEVTGVPRRSRKAGMAAGEAAAVVITCIRAAVRYRHLRVEDLP